MRLLVNAVSAKRGGAVTYLQNVLGHLRSRLNGPDDHMAVWRGEASTAAEQWPAGIEYHEDVGASGGSKAIGGSLGRIWFDQVRIPKLMKVDRFDALFSTANFGPLHRVRGNVLLVRNTAYFDSAYLDRIQSRKVHAYYRLQRWLTLRSMRAAGVVLFPSQAMRDLVAPHFGCVQPNWAVAHYGISASQFSARECRVRATSPVALLNVSLYSDQKNFGTLLRAVDLLNAAGERKVHLTLTAGFDREWHAASDFFPNFAAERVLFQKLQAAGDVTDVGWKKHSEVAALYERASIFVFPSYTESFGHPLVEAMAAGLPVIAADIPISRELCGDAAIYFSRFDQQSLAITIERLIGSPDLQVELGRRGRKRAAEFRWSAHVDRLLEAFRIASGR